MFFFLANFNLIGKPHAIHPIHPIHKINPTSPNLSNSYNSYPVLVMWMSNAMCSGLQLGTNKRMECLFRFLWRRKKDKNQTPKTNKWCCFFTINLSTLFYNANLFDEFDMQQEEDCNTWQCKGGWFSQWNYAVCTLWGAFHTYIQRNTFYWKCFFAHWHVYFQFMDVW